MQLARGVGHHVGDAASDGCLAKEGSGWHNDEDDGWLCSLGSGVSTAVGSGPVLAGSPVKRAMSKEELEQFHLLCRFTEVEANTGPVRRQIS